MVIFSSKILRALRSYYGISARDFNKDTGISRVTLTKLENDDGNIQTCHISKLKKILAYYTEKGAVITSDKKNVTIVFPVESSQAREIDDSESDIFSYLSEQEKVALMQKIAISLKSDVDKK